MRNDLVYKNHIIDSIEKIESYTSQLVLACPPVVDSCPLEGSAPCIILKKSGRFLT